MDNLQGNFIFLPALTIVQRAFNLSEATTKDQSRIFSNFRWKLNYPSPWPHLCLLQDKHGPSSLLSCLAGPQTCLPPVGWQSRSRAPPCRPGPPHHQWQWSNLVQNNKLVIISYILHGVNIKLVVWCTSFPSISYRVIRCHHSAVSCPGYFAVSWISYKNPVWVLHLGFGSTSLESSHFAPGLSLISCMVSDLRPFTYPPVTNILVAPAAAADSCRSPVSLLTF